jgi:hypothetical protein
MTAAEIERLERIERRLALLLRHFRITDPFAVEEPETNAEGEPC